MYELIVIFSLGGKAHLPEPQIYPDLPACQMAAQAKRAGSGGEGKRYCCVPAKQVRD